MAIELKVTGRCQACPALEPQISKLYADGRTVDLFVSCANLELCQHIERHIVENPYRGPELEDLEI